MEFIRRARPPGRVLALLPGAWNPPTRAHLTLAHAALAIADEAVFVLPRALPHKEFAGPSPETRLEWLDVLARQHPSFSAARSEGGLFLEMAREARRAGAAEVWVVCGADAAERIAGWPYPEGLEIESQLENDYGLLVAPRASEWTPPPHLAHRVRPLAVGAELQTISSSLVRTLISQGKPWHELVPEELRDVLARAYGCS